MSDAPSRETLLEANAAFYHAFESLDMRAMAAVWEESDRLFCVHPGWQALHGREAVIGSWRNIMGNTGRIRFTLSGVRAHLEGLVGRVTLHEKIESIAGGQRHSAAAIVTNLFAFDEDDGLWRLFHHHASLASVPEATDIVN
jgi:ketosteroid isomerase-like protein